MGTNYWNKKAYNYDNHIKKSENIYEKVIKLTKNEIDKSQILLDIGTGTGAIPIALTNSIGKIIATDYSEEMIKKANVKITESKINNIIFKVQDCYNINFKNEMFDVILAANILHLLDEPEQFLNSIKRFLKPNGKLIIPNFMNSENIKTKIISRIMKYKGHPIITKFNSKSMTNLIEKCGYKVEKKILLSGIMPMLFIVAKKQ